MSACPPLVIPRVCLMTVQCVQFTSPGFLNAASRQSARCGRPSPQIPQQLWVRPPLRWGHTTPHTVWIWRHDKVALLHDFPKRSRWDKGHDRTQYLLYSLCHLPQYVLKPNVIWAQQLFRCNDRHSVQFPLSSALRTHPGQWLVLILQPQQLIFCWLWKN